MTEEGQQAISAIHSSALHLLRVARTADAQSGLSAARLSVLSILVFGGPRTIGGLAQAEEVRSPTMTALVNGLEDEGLVRRRAGSGDQRQVLVQATKRGDQVMRRAQARRLEILQGVFAGLQDSELRLLASAARVIGGAVAGHISAATGGK